MASVVYYWLCKELVTQNADVLFLPHANYWVEKLIRLLV